MKTKTLDVWTITYSLFFGQALKSSEEGLAKKNFRSITNSKGGNSEHFLYRILWLYTDQMASYIIGLHGQKTGFT